MEEAKFDLGGQAVIEGVMMRSKNHWAVAVRKLDGEIGVEAKPLNSLAERFPIFGKVVFRGILALIETISLGIKALTYSANQNLGEGEKLSTRELTLTLILTFLLVLAFFLIVPYYLTRTARIFTETPIYFTLIEGSIRISFFVLYILFISRMKDIRRVFQYHGAEHKSIHAYEAGEGLSVEKVARFSTAHTRCGTTFLLIVMVISILSFSFLPTRNPILRIGGKLLIIPFIAGISYELLKLAGRNKNSLFLKLLMKPGLWLQSLTTREPSSDQLEVAIVALKRVLEMEKGETGELRELKGRRRSNEGNEGDGCFAP